MLPQSAAEQIGLFELGYKVEHRGLTLNGDLSAIL